MPMEKRTLSRNQKIEQSIHAKYRKTIWSKVVRALDDYQMINEGDRLMVCISGGKDSFLLAKVLQLMRKTWPVSFELYFVCMDPGYTEEHIRRIKENAEMMEIELIMFDSPIFQSVSDMKADKPCYMCARMRRGYLYHKAQELSCNKIVLGHHFDDVIETSLLSIFYSSEVKTMIPTAKSEYYPGLELIRPLYYVREDTINAWVRYNGLTFMNCGCSLLEERETDSKRLYIKNLIKELKKDNRNIDINIFRALDNINLDYVIGYVKDGERHSFMDEYEEE